MTQNGVTEIFKKYILGAVVELFKFDFFLQQSYEHLVAYNNHQSSF